VALPLSGATVSRAGFLPADAVSIHDNGQADATERVRLVTPPCRC
jgi:hypothetical protein